MKLTIELTHDTDDEGRSGWVAEIAELPGCMSQGDTIPVAVANLNDALHGWADAWFNTYDSNSFDTSVMGRLLRDLKEQGLLR